MNLLKKFTLELITAPILLIVFFVTRLITIMSVPIFTDEAIYTRWAQIAKIDSGWRFISLTDGKQPSFIWFDMVMMRFVEDPLLAGRLVSVFAGLVLIVGVYFLTLEIFKDKKNFYKTRIIALITAGLAVIYPFSLVYDRLALYESLLAAFFIWALYFQVLLVRRLRFDLAMVLGAILGGGVLTKSSMFLSIYMSPLLIILLNFQKNGLKGRIIKFLGYLLVAAVIANVFYLVLRLSPYFHIINQKNAIFVYTPGYWLTAIPFLQKIEFLFSNSRGLLDWFFNYFSIPFFLLVVSSFFITKKYFREKVLLFIWFLLPFLSLCVFGKTLYPRYLFFMTMPLFPLVGLGLFELLKKFKGRIIRGALLVAVLIIPLWTNYFILFDFPRAPIPKIDLEQLINGWPAGGGIKESIEFFEKESRSGEIMVGTQGTFGLMPAVYEIYLKDNANVRINGFWPVESNQVPSLLLDYVQRIPTYFVFYQPCPNCDFPGDAPDGLNLEKIATYKKGIGDAYLTIYKVKPQIENEQ